MTRIGVPTIAALFAAAWVWFWPTAVLALEPSFVVVTAQDDVQQPRITREALARIFLKKQIYWPDGDRIQAVNLPVSHPLRQSFSQAVLGAAPEALEDYWRDMYFHGVLPPHVVASEEAVVLFVSSTPGAIGYLSRCAMAHKLTIVLVVGEPPDCPR